MAKKGKSKGFDMDAVLSGAAKANGGSKSKSKVPVYDTPELEQAILHWLAANKEIKTQESIAENAFRVILPRAQELRIQSSRDLKEFLNSVKLRVDGGTVTFTQKTTFSNIEQESKPVLVKVCDEEGVDFDRYFTPTPVISLKSDLTDEQRKEAVGKLVETFGADWTDFFDVKYPIKVESQLLKDEVFEEPVAKLMERLGPGSAANVIKPYKPSLRAS